MSEKSDWRSFCSPIQDQGNCGSCTAFGSIGVWEALIRIKDNNPSDPVKLSERDLFFCSGGTCEDGNTVEAVLNKALNGVCTEACCPYNDALAGTNFACGDDRCENWWVDAKKLKSWTGITDVAQMKKLLNSEPLVSTMAVHQSFMNYVSGVYESQGASDPIVGYHCIAIVGYDDLQGAWLLRNSWSTEWGMNGYCWIKYGDSEIDSQMYQLTSNGPVPEPNPKPSTCPLGNGIARALNSFAHILRRKGRFYYLTR